MLRFSELVVPEPTFLLKEPKYDSGHSCLNFDVEHLHWLFDVRPACWHFNVEHSLSEIFELGRSSEYLHLLLKHVRFSKHSY